MPGLAGSGLAGNYKHCATRRGCREPSRHPSVSPLPPSPTRRSWNADRSARELRGQAAFEFGCCGGESSLWRPATRTEASSLRTHVVPFEVLQEDQLLQASCERRGDGRGGGFGKEDRDMQHNTWAFGSGERLTSFAVSARESSVGPGICVGRCGSETQRARRAERGFRTEAQLPVFYKPCERAGE